MDIQSERLSTPEMSRLAAPQTTGTISVSSQPSIVPGSMGAMAVSSPSQVPGAVNRPRVSLTKLPPELMDRVAQMLPERDVIALGQTSRAIRHVAQDWVARAISTEHATQVRTLNGFRSVLLKIGAISRYELREKPLAELAVAIGSLPEGERRAAFGEVRQDVAALPEQHRAQPLAALNGVRLVGV